MATISCTTVKEEFSVSSSVSSKTERSLTPEEELMRMREPMSVVVNQYEFPLQIIEMIGREVFETISRIDLPRPSLIRLKHIPESGMMKGRMQDNKVYFAFAVTQDEIQGIITLYQERKGANLESFSVATTYPYGISDLRFEPGPLNAETLQVIREIFDNTHLKIKREIPQSDREI